MLSEMLAAAQRRPLRLNVHLCLPRAVQRAARTIHADIASQTPSAVDLRPTSPHLPHLTLSMGFVADPRELESISRDVAAVAAVLPPIALQMTHTSQVPARDAGFAYCFLELTPTDELLELRERVHASLEPRYVDVGRPPYPFAPHVTVGYVAAAVRLPKVPRAAATADRLGLSVAGDHGVCVGRLGEHYLLGSAPTPGDVGV